MDAKKVDLEDSSLEDSRSFEDEWLRFSKEDMGLSYYESKPYKCLSDLDDIARRFFIAGRCFNRNKIDHIKNSKIRTDSETHVSCISYRYGINLICSGRYGINLICSGGDMPIRILQMSWNDVESLIRDKGRDIEGEEALDLVNDIK